MVRKVAKRGKKQSCRGQLGSLTPKVNKQERKKHDSLTPEQINEIGKGVRVKAVCCGKKACKSEPHFLYVYQRKWERGKCKEIYLGKYIPNKGEVFSDPRVKKYLQT